MNTKEKAGSPAQRNLITKAIPVLNLHIMSDDEWNRLAYRNYMERQEKSRCLKGVM